MGDSFQIAIEIISVGLEVRFPCSLHLQNEGRKITNEVRLVKGFFNINQTIQIRSDTQKEKQNWEVSALLSTDRGSKYTCGMLTIPYKRLLQMPPMTNISLPFTKCSDKNAKITLKVVEIRSQKSSVSINEVDYASFSDSPVQVERLRLSSPPNNRQRGPASTGRFGRMNDQLKTMRNNTIAEDLELDHLKQKVQDLQRLIVEKNTHITNLEKDLDQFKGQNQKLIQRQRQNYQSVGQKDKLLRQIEQANTKMKEELQNMKAANQSREMEIQIQAQNQMNDLNQIRLQNEENLLQDIQILQAKIAEFEENLEMKNQQNGILKAELQQIQTLYDQNTHQNTTKMDELTEKLSLAQTTIQKLRKVQIANITLTQEKESLILKNAEMKKDLESYSALKRNNSILQEELNLLKRTNQKTGKNRQLLLQKITSEYRSELETLHSQKSTLKEEILRTLQTNKNLQQKMDSIEIKMQKHEYEKKNLTQQNQSFKKTVSQLQDVNNALKEQNSKLTEQNASFSGTINKLEDKLQVSSSELENVQQKYKELQNRNRDISSKAEEYRFENEKYRLQFQLNSSQNENNHIGCKEIQKKTEGKVLELETKNSELQNLVIELREEEKEAERVLHQMKNQQIKYVETIAKLNQKLEIGEKKIAKLQQAIKQKQNTISELIEDRQSSMEMVKQYQKRLLEATENYHAILEQKHKVENEEYQKNTRIKQLQLEVESKTCRIEQLEEEEVSLNHKNKQAEEKNLILQNQAKGLGRQVERIKQKNLKLIEKLVDVGEADPVETLINYHRNRMTKWESQLATMEQALKINKKQLQEKSKEYEIIAQQNKFYGDLEQKNKSQIDYLEQMLHNKEVQYESINNDHNELLSIHEEYIFSFNRYKIEKEEEISKLNSKCSSLTEAVAELELQINQLREEIEVYQKQSEDHRQKQIELQEQIKNYQKELDKTNAEVNDKQSLLAAEKQRVNKLTTEVRLKMQEINDLHTQKDFMESKVETVSNELNQSKQMMVQMVKSKERVMKEGIQKSEHLLNLETEVQNLKILNEGLQSDKENCENDRKDLKQKNKALCKQIKSLEVSIGDQEENTQRMSQKIEQKVNQIQSLQTQINEQSLEIQKMKEMQKVKKRQTEERIQTLEAALRDSAASKENLEVQFVTNQTELQKRLEDSQKEKQSLEKQVQILANKINILQTQNSELRGEVSSKKNELDEVTSNYMVAHQEVKEKEEALFALSGKMTEIQMRCSNQERLSRVSMEKTEQKWINKYQVLKQEYEDFVSQNEKVKIDMQYQLEHLRQDHKNKSNEVERLKDENKDVQKNANARIKLFQDELANLSRTYKERTEQLQLSLRQKEEEAKANKNQAELINLTSAQTKSEVKLLQQQLANLKQKFEESVQRNLEHSQQWLEKEKQQRKKKQEEEERIWETHREIRKQFYGACKDLAENLTKKQFVDLTKYLEEKVMSLIERKDPV